MAQNNPISLVNAKRGSVVKVLEVPDGTNKARLIRLGIHKGEMIRCLEKLPGGTIVIEKNRQEIALGNALARSILVTLVRKDSQQN